MRYLIKVEQAILYPVEVEADSREEAEAEVQAGAWTPCGDPEPADPTVRSIRELD